MSGTKKVPLAWVTMGLLAMLVAMNVVFLILLRTGGPLIGVAFYGALLVAVCREQVRGNRQAMVGGLIGLVVHIAEATILGWTSHPAVMVLNIVLPAVLVPVAWLAGRQARRGMV